MKLAMPLVLVVALAAAGSAQYSPGDTLVLDQRNAGQTWPLLGVTPQGSVYTVSTSLTFSGWSIMPSPDNRTMWASGKGTGGYTTASIAPDGTVTNFNVDFNNLFGAMDVDDTGAAILGNLVGPELLRYQQNQLTTVFSGAPLVSVFGGGIDTLSGEFVLLQSTDILRAKLDGTVQVTSAIGSLGRAGNGGAHFDPDNSAMLVARGGALMQLSLGSPSVLNTLNASFATSIGGFDRDVRNGEFVIPTMGTTPQLLRYDARRQAVTSMIPLTGSSPFGAAIASGRHLAAGAAATPGSAFPMLVSSPNEVGIFYVTAVSFATSNGLPLPGGKRLYLVPDTLFQLSLSNAGIFRNFQGVLNARGEGYPTLNLPNIQGLRGLRFYAAVATLSAQGIGLMSDPIGVTIR